MPAGLEAKLLQKLRLSLEPLHESFLKESGAALFGQG
jgi:hypothetical protein